jgi:hypothetical protein
LRLTDSNVAFNLEGCGDPWGRRAGVGAALAHTLEKVGADEVSPSLFVCVAVDVEGAEFEELVGALPVPEAPGPIVER